MGAARETRPTRPHTPRGGLSMAVSARHGRHRTRTGTAGYAVIPPSCRRAFRARFYPRYSHDTKEPMASKGGSRSWQIQARCNLLERGPLGRADVLPALPVSVGDPVREVEHEPLVVLKLLRRRRTLEQANRIAKMLQTLFFEFLDRVVPGVVGLGLRCHDLVQQCALTVLPPRLNVCLRYRDRFPEAPAALRCDNDQAR